MLRLRNQCGSSLLYIAYSLLFVATMSLSIVSLSASDTGTTSDAVDRIKAEQYSQAGLEWALYRLNQGEEAQTSAAPGITVSSTAASSNRARGMRYQVATTALSGDPSSFSDGTFAVTADPESGLITSIGESGAAQAEHRINALFSANCFELLAGATFNFPSDATSGTMNDVGFRKLDTDTDGKDCVDTIIIAEASLSWTGEEPTGMTGISIDGASYYTTDAGTLVAATTGAANGEWVDLSPNFVLNDPDTHEFDTIHFSYPYGTPPEEQTFVIEVLFADGSTASHEYPYTTASAEPGSTTQPTTTEGTEIITEGISEPPCLVDCEETPQEEEEEEEEEEEPDPTGLTAKIYLNFTLMDHTRLDFDGTNSYQSYDGEYPCDTRTAAASPDRSGLIPKGPVSTTPKRASNLVRRIWKRTTPVGKNTVFPWMTTSAIFTITVTSAPTNIRSESEAKTGFFS